METRSRALCPLSATPSRITKGRNPHTTTDYLKPVHFFEPIGATADKAICSLQVAANVPIVMFPTLQLGEVGKRELIPKGESQAGVLQHVIEREIFDQVFCAVDVIVRVLECRLDHESRRISSLGGGGVVRAGVPALGLDKGDVAVLSKLIV